MLVKIFDRGNWILFYLLKDSRKDGLALVRFQIADF